MKFNVLFSGLMLLVMSQWAVAWDGVHEGKIAYMESTAAVGATGEDMTFRVSLEGIRSLCEGANTDMPIAYLNSTDINYKVMVATLMMAKLTGAIVSLMSNRAPSGYCHIGYIIVLP